MNNFQITISAVDNVTKTVNQINRNWANMIAPITKMRRSVGNLSEALGLPEVRKHMTEVKESAGQVAEKIGSIVAPLAAVVGVGSIAALGDLATKWGEVGFKISETSQHLGMSTSQLQAWHGAAKLAGVSTEALDSGMQALGKTFEDASKGRNQGAYMLMAKLGMHVNRTKDGAVDANDAMMQVSRALQRQGGNVQAKDIIADEFGVSGLLPLIGKGPKQIDGLVSELRSMGYVMSGPAVKAAEEFQKRLNKLHLSVDVLQESIGEALLPVLQPAVDQLTQFVKRYREPIANGIAEYTNKLADAIGSIDFKAVTADAEAFAKQTGEVVEKLGGMRTVLYAAGTWVAAGFAAPILSATVSLTTLLGKISAVRIAVTALSGTLMANPWILGVAAAVYPGSLNDGEQESLANRRKLLERAQKLPGYHSGMSYEQMQEFVENGGPDTPNDEHGNPRSKLPRGLRNNNPGNVIWGGFAMDHGAKKPDKDGFAIFPDMQTGYDANIQLLQNYAAEGRNTIAKIIAKWAPAKAGNNVDAYVADVSKQTGIDPNQVLDDAALHRVAVGMFAHENGMPLKRIPKPKTDDDGDSEDSGDDSEKKVAIDLHVHGLPAGAGVTASNRGELGPTVVAYSMPTN